MSSPTPIYDKIIALKDLIKDNDTPKASVKEIFTSRAYKSELSYHLLKSSYNTEKI